MIPTNMAVPPVGQMFQIGNLPLLNTLLYRNSPAAISSRNGYSRPCLVAPMLPSDLGLVDPVHHRPNLGREVFRRWIGCLPQVDSRRLGRSFCPFAGSTPEQQAFDHQEGSHIAVMDKAFADSWRVKGDDFGDLGDY